MLYRESIEKYSPPCRKLLTWKASSIRTAARFGSWHCSTFSLLLHVNKREKLVVKGKCLDNTVCLTIGSFSLCVGHTFCETHKIYYRPLISFILHHLGGIDGIEREYAEISLSLKFSLGKIVCVCSLVRPYSHMSQQWSYTTQYEEDIFYWNILSIYDAMKAQKFVQ